MIVTRAKPLICLAVLVLATGCATQSVNDYAYKLYAGPERPISELATLDISHVDTITVDKLKVNRWDYGTVHLLPGTHALRIEKSYGFSVMVEPSMHGSFENTLDVELEAGRTYKVKSERTHGQGYRVFFWVEDAASDEVIAGVKKP